MSSQRYYLDGKGGLAPEGAEAQRALSAYAGRFVLAPTSPDQMVLLRVPALGGKGKSPKVVLSGDASGFPLPDLIAFLSQSRWTGLVRVHAPEGERSISLKDGEVRSATSDDPSDRLGEVIVRLGYVKRDRLEQALRDTPPSKVGRALVEQNLLQAHELYKCVNHQVSEIFHAMVLCKEGVFTLMDQEPEEKGGGVGLQLSTQSLLMDAIRKIDEMAHFRHRISHGRMYVLGKRAGDGKLEEDETRVLALATGTRTVLELGQAARLSEFDVTKTVFRLLEGGYVSISEQPAVEASGNPGTHSGPKLEGVTSEPERVIQTFNAIFQEILSEVDKQSMGREFLAAANAALAGQALSQSPVLQGIHFDVQGRIPDRELFAQFERSRAGLGKEPVHALRQALSDVMFFLLFQAGELLESRADEDLARRVKELLATLEPS